MTTARSEELRAALQRTQDRIVAACAAAGRDRRDLTLVVVTKFFPAEDIAALVGLGVGDIGENRDQEARTKVEKLTALLEPGSMPRIHFVGQAQRNKAGSIARYADVVHSLDRSALAVALNRGAMRAARTLDVLIQVDLDPRPDAGRGGARPSEVADLAEVVEQMEWLRLRGVMTVAPLDHPADEAFARLAEISTALREDHPGAAWISAGMSGDLESAIAHGATHLRVGTAILGSRAPHR